MPQAAHPPNRDANEGTQSRLVAFPRSPEEERPAHNLPLELTSFIGRQREIAEVKRLLLEDKNRLLTLSGSGGCGKTRLALAVAFEVVNSFEDGVWWVELASLSDPDLLPQAVASALGSALGVREVLGRSLSAMLVGHLKPKKTLLVLDNCEHLVEGCAALANTLLRSCPDLKILATSREPLSIAGERSWPVPYLSTPDPQHLPPIELMGRFESIRLFVERAHVRRPDFSLRPENAAMVAKICRRLEGIPLAIELAAARVGTLSVGQIAEKLGDSLTLLVGRDRVAPERQRTLRGTLDWSYDLLSQRERELYGRLSVFAGGWTLEAAEAVGVDDGMKHDEILDLLDRLVDKSLVVAGEASGESELRYRMLELVRRYGLERLEESGEAERVQERHARYYLTLAEQAAPALQGAQQAAWLERLENEQDNLRWALGLSLERGDAETALRLGAALWRGFWYVRGYLSEGRRWLEEALAVSGEGATVLRAKALNGAGHLAWCQSDFEHAAMQFRKSLTLSRQLEDKAGVAAALNGLGRVAYSQGNLAEGRAMLEEALAIHRELNDAWGTAESLFVSGIVALYQGDYAVAHALLEESVTLFRDVGDREGVAVSLGVLGMVALSQGAYAAARSLLEETQAIFKSLADPRGVARALSVLGDVDFNQGDYEAAYARYEEAIGLLKDFVSAYQHGPAEFGPSQVGMAQVGLDDRWWMAWCLEGLGGVAAARKQTTRAIRIFGAAKALRDIISAPRPAAHRAAYERILATARAQLDETTFAATWAEGKAMTAEQAMEYALSKEEEPAPSPPASATTTLRSPSSFPAGLSAREAEVLKLVAEGLTNNQVADELFISPRTINRHLTSIYHKLGVSSRAAATRFALEHDLA